MAEEKSGKKERKNTLSFSLIKRFLFSRRVFTRPANKRSNWSTRDLRIDLRILISGRALTDLKLPPRSCDARYISSSLYLSVSICLVYFISLHPSVLFSLAVILAVMLRLPTRVSRGTFSSACAKRSGGPPSHYQNSNVLLFSILQIESKYKIASSSINNLYRKNTKG